MKRFASAAAIAGLALTATVITAPSASADERLCRGALGKITVDGDIRVPAGAFCQLGGTTVKGNVIVGGGSTLRAYAANIDGNLKSWNSKLVYAQGNSVDGNIQLSNSYNMNVKQNRVNGDIQLFNNKQGHKYANWNRVDGNLQCKANAPTLSGSGNVVNGNKEDQCRRF